jgi:hypothetical protein
VKRDKIPISIYNRDFSPDLVSSLKGDAMMLRNKSLVIIILSVIWIIAGCASKDFNEPGVISQSKKDISRTFSMNFQDAWKFITQAAGTMPVVSANKETGVITTDWIKAKSDILYSGYGETRIPYTIRYKFTIKVKPSSRGTTVTVTNKEQYLADSVTAGIDFSGSIYQWLDTQSSTNKEAAFLDEIENVMPSKK